MTEIAHYLRLLFAKVGERALPGVRRAHRRRARRTSSSAALRALTRRRTTLLAPAVRARKGTYLDVFTAAARAGRRQRACVDGALVSIDTPPRLDEDAGAHHRSRRRTRDARRSSTARRFDRALAWGDGMRSKVRAAPAREAAALHDARPARACGTGVPELDPRWFSFNTKQGQCERLRGHRRRRRARRGRRGASPPTPARACDGSRLAPMPRAVRLAGERYHEVAQLPVDCGARARSRGSRFDRRRARASPRRRSRELVRRLEFVERGRPRLPRRSIARARTLSGGEMQRLRLSAQLGSGPHRRALRARRADHRPAPARHRTAPREPARARRHGVSTVLVVEHDADTIRAADHLIDLGPAGGRNGGHIVAEGPPAEVLANPASPTARALSSAAARVARPRALAARRVRSSSCAARAPTTCKDVDLARPARAHDRRRRRLRLGQEHARAAGALSRRCAEALGLRRADARPASTRSAARARSHARARRRSVADRPHAALGAGHVPRRLGRDPASSSPRRPRRRSAATGRRASRSTRRAGGRCAACDGQGVIAHEMSLPARRHHALRGVRRGALRAAPRSTCATSASPSATCSSSPPRRRRTVFAAHPKIARPLRDAVAISASATCSSARARTRSPAARRSASSSPPSSPPPRGTSPRSTCSTSRRPASTSPTWRGSIDVLDRLVAARRHAGHHRAPPGGDRRRRPRRRARARRAATRGGRIVAEGAPAEVARAGTPTAPVIAGILGDEPRQRAG